MREPLRSNLIQLSTIVSVILLVCALAAAIEAVWRLEGWGR